MLIEYVHPSHMPSIDDAKSPQVTPEVSVHIVEILLKFDISDC